MKNAIDIRGLTKEFGGTRALDGVDLVVPAGSVFGFLGPNGAGKTTTLRILTGLARPTTGTVRILGVDADSAGDDVRRRIGFLPDVPGFYGWMTAPEFLTFAGRLFGLSGEQLRERVTVLLDMAGLTGVKTAIGGYSRGMKQRLGVAQALVNAPELLMLDEPTSALDPVGRRELLEMLVSLRGRTTVFFSTHILADVERVCDTVAILDHGKVVAQAPIEELQQRHGEPALLLTVDQRPDELLGVLREQPWVTRAGVDAEGRIEMAVGDPDEAARAIPRLLADRGVGIRRLEAGETGLEDVFVELVGGDR